MRSNRRVCARLFGVIWCVWLFGTQSLMVQSTESVSLSISRNFGTDLGNGQIQGDFTVRGQGSEGIINLTLFFNGSLVFTIESNQLSYRFDTEDYPVGSMEIRLEGMDLNGTMYTDIRMVEFISSDVGTYILIGTIALVVLVVGFRLRKYIRRKPKTLPTMDDLKKNVKVDLDHDLF